MLHTRLFSSFTRLLPWRCTHCGAGYVKVSAAKTKLSITLPDNAYCCPNGHEAYYDVFTYDISKRRHYDFVKQTTWEK